MPKEKSIPEKLFKYRRFDVTALNLITDHRLYFANPRSFNDPLDCELAIEPDISPKKMSDLLKALFGPDREDHWHHDIASSVHYASEYGDIKVPGDARNYLMRLLADSVGSEVKKEFDTRGALAFSATWQSVLMWSHYADDHAASASSSTRANCRTTGSPRYGTMAIAQSRRATFMPGNLVAMMLPPVALLTRISTRKPPTGTTSKNGAT